MEMKRVCLLCLHCEHQAGVEYIGGELIEGKMTGGRLVGLCKLNNTHVPLGHLGDPMPECPIWAEEGND